MYEITRITMLIYNNNKHYYESKNIPTPCLNTLSQCRLNEKPDTDGELAQCVSN